MDEATYLDVIIFSLLGGLFSLVGGVLLLRGSNKWLKKFSRFAVPFAAGALLAAVFLDLLLEGVELADSRTVLLSCLIGVILFFIFERLTHWFHHHHDEDKPAHKSAALIILADTLHNAIDGVVIASAFLISVPTGIVTTLAVAAHEIPQEIGDFGILLSKGLNRVKVLVVNILSSFATVVAAIAVFALGSYEALPIGVLFGLSAGFLLYIAASDLIPTIHQSRAKRGKVDKDILFLLAGVIVVSLAINIAHNYKTDIHDTSDKCTSEQVLSDECDQEDDH